MSTNPTTTKPLPLPLRPPEFVMQLERLGSTHQTRLSFVRSLVRKMMREQWQIETRMFDLDADGYGTAIYTIDAAGEPYSMVIFAQPLADHERSDRVIATKWDIACALCAGLVSDERIELLRCNVPKQEVGRNETDVLVLTRANKSTRNFDYFVDCLSRGEQPDPELIARVGYLHRTTAVYGNGKFGIADFAKVQDTNAFCHSFSAQMFTVFMVRHFSIAQVEHIARHRAPDKFVPLDDALKRFIGIGNATGLGMAPFLIKHPKIIHAWLHTREMALARVVNAPTVTIQHVAQLLTLFDKVSVHFSEAYTDDHRQKQNTRLVIEGVAHLKQQLQKITTEAVTAGLPTDLWQQLIDWSVRNTSIETQELLCSLLLELYPNLVDELDALVDADERTTLQPDMPLRSLKQLIERQYRWALDIDFDAAGATHYFWYFSLDKEEPRLGERAVEPGVEKEMNIVIGRSVQQLYDHLATISDESLDQPVLLFLMQHPSFKGIIRRIQSLEHDHYAEIQTNVIDESCLPIHLLRCKLAFFGASKFDPKSDRWVRITLFQGAPLVKDIGQEFVDDWCFPCKPTLEQGTFRKINNVL